MIQYFYADEINLEFIPSFVFRLLVILFCWSSPLFLASKAYFLN